MLYDCVFYININKYYMLEVKRILMCTLFTSCNIPNDLTITKQFNCNLPHLRLLLTWKALF